MDTTDITLRDGRTVHVRPTRLDDEAEIVQAFERMSAEARYMRLMHVVREPDRERMRAVISSFPEKGVGRVATVPAADGYDIVGSVIAIFAEDEPRCEFAVTVAAEFGGSGLATRLMTLLMDECARRGMQVMEGFVLSENQAMLRLARKLGFSVGFDPDDASVRICRKTLVPAG